MIRAASGPGRIRPTRSLTRPRPIQTFQLSTTRVETGGRASLSCARSSERGSPTLLRQGASRSAPDRLFVLTYSSSELQPRADPVHEFTTAELVTRSSSDHAAPP